MDTCYVRCVSGNIIRDAGTVSRSVGKLFGENISVRKIVITLIASDAEGASAARYSYLEF